MSPEIDYDLTLNQWEALKALRVPNRRALNKSVVNSLVALQLVEIADGFPIIKPQIDFRQVVDPARRRRVQGKTAAIVQLC